MSSPSANMDCGTKMATLWQTNKPVCIALMIAGFLILVGVVLLVFFLIIKPKLNSSTQASGSNIAVEATAKHLYHHLRGVMGH